MRSTSIVWTHGEKSIAQERWGLGREARVASAHITLKARINSEELSACAIRSCFQQLLAKLRHIHLETPIVAQKSNLSQILGLLNFARSSSLLLALARSCMLFLALGRSSSLLLALPRSSLLFLAPLTSLFVPLSPF